MIISGKTKVTPQFINGKWMFIVDNFEGIIIDREEKYLDKLDFEKIVSDLIDDLKISFSITYPVEKGYIEEKEYYVNSVEDVYQAFECFTNNIKFKYNLSYCKFYIDYNDDVNKYIKLFLKNNFLVKNEEI